MAKINQKLTAAVEAYFVQIGQVRASGGATGELSYYGPLTNLLNAVGTTLDPKVFCISQLANQGAGHPDFGLYAAQQVQRGKPRKGQMPERGVIEMKAMDDDTWVTVESDQVSRYWDRYRLVLVTNTRDFVLVGEDESGRPVKLEAFRLVDDIEGFHNKLERPRAFAHEVGAGFGEYLSRVLSHRAVLTEPKDLAWLLASYARDGLARVEAAEDASALRTVRSALEEALGVRFEGGKGTHFFHSTLVQTLFYGIFSAWVLWSRSLKSDDGPLFEGNYDAVRFNWREAVWHLRVPALRALFQQLSDPGRLQSLGLVEVLDWTAAALDRVDRTTFFSKFDEGDAVSYFYEPFLQAFDPKLRKQMGVWYTPKEVVRYMVARVDLALKDDLSIAEGLAAENVYVLDPCCGTGAYLAEVLCRIANNLKEQGLGALIGTHIKQAAKDRVFGFEIMPAPFVVAHLQVGLTMQNLDAPLASDGTERAGIFLTNALTGWEPTEREKQLIAFPEMAEERDRANQVKRDRPILVVLGNPPYDGFAGMAVGEERELSEAYRTTKQVRRPEGQGLNELYVRFFRMAERRIAEKTGQGVVCFISNYSWLDGLSFPGMRERYLEVFDEVRIDCLNGDVRKGGKTPDGRPDSSVFTTDNTTGIQVGTAIATLVRKADHAPTDTVHFRHLWGQEKRATLLATAEDAPVALYEEFKPVLPLGLPFMPTVVSEDWFDWPALPDLFPISFPGVKTSRDEFLVDVDLDRLRERVADYFNVNLSHEEITRRYPAVMKTTAGYDARAVRDELIKRGGPYESGFIRFSYRPFDNRWLYWEEDGFLLDRPRADYRPHVFEGNRWLSSAQSLRKGAGEPQTCSTKHLSSLHLIERTALMFPTQLRDFSLESGIEESILPNLSDSARRYLDNLDATAEDLFHYVLAVLHDPAYLETNAEALGMGWPRIPLPGWPDGNAEGAAESIDRSKARGQELEKLLDPDTPVPGVTEGALRKEIAAIAIPATIDDRNMTGEDFALIAGWGRYGNGNAVTPGKGRIIERAYTADECAALGDALPIFGRTTFDIYLNNHAFWSNVPATVWTYQLGGYQVLKKWLSYREKDILGRALLPAEIQYFTDTVRRIAAVLLIITQNSSKKTG